MSQPPAKEWEDMSETQRNEIKARLISTCDTDATAVPTDLRARLARASATRYPQR